MPNPDLSRLKIERPTASASPTDAGPSYLSRLAPVVGAFLLGVVSAWLLLPRRIAPAPQIAPPAAVVTSAAVQASVLNATGYVVAQRQAAVASKATGRLKELRVDEGDTVKRDEVLAVLENDDKTALVRNREANLNALRARIDFMQAELRDAERQLNRTRRLARTSAVAQAELDEAEARHQKAAAELAAAQANVSLSEAQLEEAKVELSYTYIIAPFDGTVLTKNADVGEVVAPFGSSSNARAAVVTIADMTSLEVEADVSEANIARVKVGQEAEITLDSFPGKVYRGTVSKIVPTVDRAKATVQTKIRFTDRDEHVLPEMSARVTFKVAP